VHVTPLSAINIFPVEFQYCHYKLRVFQKLVFFPESKYQSNLLLYQVPGTHFLLCSSAAVPGFFPAVT
jgi:hypothetical protein